MSAIILAMVATASAAPSKVVIDLDCIRLSGAGDLVRRVAEYVSSPTPCRSVEARLFDSGDGAIAIEIEGRPIRRASTPVVAATILESLAELSMVQALIAGPPDDPIVRSPGGPRPVPRAIATTVAADTRFGGAVRAEALLEEDGVFGTGVFARGDLHLGWMTAWAGGRFSVAPSVVEGGASGGRRTAADLLAGADFSIAAGDFVFAPGAAAGLSLVRTSRESTALACAFQRCEAVTTAFVPDDLVVTSFGLRLEAGVRVAWAIGGEVAVEASVSVAYAPLASREGFVPSYAEELSPSEQIALSLPPEARLGGRLGVGVRWGVW